MRKNGFVRILIVAVVAALSVVAVGAGTAGAQSSGTQGVTSSTISVGGFAGITNPVGQPYGAGSDGAQAYFNYINAKGGVYGRKFKLVAKLDDQSRASQDLQAARSLVEETKVFAVMPVVTQEFTAGSYLAGKGIPTLGWNINAEWATGYPTPGSFSGFAPPTTPGAANLFGEKGSYLCFNCTSGAPAYIAQQLGAKTVAVLAYSAAQSAPCAAGMAAGFKKYGINVAVMDSSIPFGFTDLGSDIDQMKSKGVQFVGTCMDIAGEVNVSLALKRAGLTNVKFYAPQGYDPGTLSKYGNELNGIYFGIDFWPFELSKQSPALTRFISEMSKIKKPINEQALAGWIDADLLYKGIKKAGPSFTQKSVVDAINTFNGYTADGIRPPTNWSFDGHGPGTEACTAYVEVVGGKFAPQFGKPGQPFVCVRDNPLPNTMDSSTIYYRPPLAGQALPTTATVPSTAPPTP